MSFDNFLYLKTKRKYLFCFVFERFSHCSRRYFRSGHTAQCRSPNNKHSDRIEGFISAFFTISRVYIFSNVYIQRTKEVRCLHFAIYTPSTISVQTLIKICRTLLVQSTVTFPKKKIRFFSFIIKKYTSEKSMHLKGSR